MIKHPQWLPVLGGILFTLVLALAGGASHAQDPALTASVDRREVSSNETLTLRVRYSGRVQSGQPDFSLLQEDFDILGRQQNNRISTVNGAVSAFTEWSLTIAPKRTGKLLIPTFKYEGHFSDAIQITVTEPSEIAGELRDIFIETEVEPNDVHVQQQVLLTYRLYTTRSIDSMDADALEIDGVSIEELPQTRYHRRINGRDYGVLEVPYALYPQASGSFTIPSLNWTLRVVTNTDRSRLGFGMGRYELKRVATEEKQIAVKSRPAAYPAGEPWLPARNLTLSEDWSASPDQFRVGEPITRTLRLEAEGLMASQLPPIAPDTAPAGLRFYPDQAEQDDRAELSGITGTRTEHVAIVPSRAGEITLPAISISWWDTASDQVRHAELPAKTIMVQGDGSAAQPELQAGRNSDSASGSETADEEEPANAGVAPHGGGPAPVSEQSGSHSWFWPLVALLFALLTGIFAFLWWQQRRRAAAGRSGQPPAADKRERQAFNDLQRSARTGDLQILRRALLHWASCRWPGQPPASLYELSAKIGNGEIEKQLLALDKSLYGSNTEAFEPGPLLQNLEQWRKQRPRVHANTGHLRSLY